MSIEPDHVMTGDPLLTYGGNAVSPMPDHPGVYVTTAALAAVEEMGGIDRLAVRLFVAWAMLRSTSQTTHRSDDGQRQHVLAYDRGGLDCGSPGLVVSLAAEVKAGHAPDCTTFPTPVLPAITWTEASEAGVLVDVAAHARRLGFFARDVALHASTWKAAVVEHDDAVAVMTPEERQRLVLLLTALPRSNYPALFTVTAPSGALVLLVADVDQWDDLVVRVAKADGRAAIASLDPVAERLTGEERLQLVEILDALPRGDGDGPARFGVDVLGAGSVRLEVEKDRSGVLVVRLAEGAS